MDFKHFKHARSAIHDNRPQTISLTVDYLFSPPGGRLLILIEKGAKKRIYGIYEDICLCAPQ